MPEASDGWNISDLADLILGGGGRSSPPSEPAGPGPAETRDPAPSSGPSLDDAAATPQDPPSQTGRRTRLQTVLTLVNPKQDAVESISRYADYWSNRGENVSVVWLGHSGVKLGMFDCSRRPAWSEEVLHAVEQAHINAVPDLVRKFSDRLVLALVTLPGWTSSPLIDAVDAVCVVVEPAPYQLIGSYDSLKSLNRLNRRHALSCFAINARSALDATRLGERFYRLGDQFLDRAIAFEGFSLAEPWPVSNCVREAFVPNGLDGRSEQLREALLASLRVSRASEAVADDLDDIIEIDLVNTTASIEDGADVLLAGMLDDHGNGVCREAPSSQDHSPLSPVHVVPIDQPIEDEGQLEILARLFVGTIFDDTVESWPLRLPGGGGARCRWIELQDGRRCVVVTTLGSASGALELASAWLYPTRADDVIILLAPHVSSELRRAADGVRARTRLFELARMPAGHPLHAVVLREVSHFY